MRSRTNRRNQRGFTLIEVMSAAVVLSILMLGIGAFWLTADHRAYELVLRQKAVFAASGEMARLTALYNRTTFGWVGPASTTGYETTNGLPSSRLTYPTSLSFYMSGSNDYTTTSSATFQSGSSFQVWINQGGLAAQNRAYVWLDQSHNVMARLSWSATNITPSSCAGSDGCYCFGPLGFGSARCQRVDLYLEYPYQLSSGSPVAGSPLRSVTLSSIVGRQT